MLDHTIIKGQLPEDAESFLSEINRMSGEGYAVLSTTSAYSPDAKLTMCVLLGKPIAKPVATRGAIGMSGGGPKGPHVNQNPVTQQENPGGG